MFANEISQNQYTVMASRGASNQVSSAVRNRLTVIDFVVS